MRRGSWLLVLAVAVALIVLGVDRYRHRFIRLNSDLVRLLPPGDLNLAYADLALVRKAKLLGVFANIKVATDQQYADFVAQTGFDYTRDLDAIAIAFDPDNTYLAGRGRFNWNRLVQFAQAHQGSCREGSCQLPATAPGRWVNFLKIQPDVLAVAVSPNRVGAGNLRPPGRRVQESFPADAVWLKLSHSLLLAPASLPLPLQIFAISLQSAEYVLLTAQPDSLRLQAHFLNAAAAGTARAQLEIQISRLRAAWQTEGDATAFAGLSTAATLSVSGDDLLGRWPISPEVLRRIQ